MSSVRVPGYGAQLTCPTSSRFIESRTRAVAPLGFLNGSVSRISPFRGKNFQGADASVLANSSSGFICGGSSLKSTVSCSQGGKIGKGKKKIGKVSVRANVIEVPPTAVRSYNLFQLENGCKLEAYSAGATDESRAFVRLEISGSGFANARLIAHWGAIRDDRSGWILPGLQPDGTQRYKNRALQSPFVKETSDRHVLTIQFGDVFDSIEFTLKDEETGEWYKPYLEGGNFRISIPKSKATKNPSAIDVPEELVRMQAFTRWERSGKQSYSKEKEKEEYERARLDIQREVLAGKSLPEIEKRLKEGKAEEMGRGASHDSASTSSDSNGNGHATAVASSKPNFVVSVPEDLVAIQAYIRWERNGKQSYSQEKERSEYMEAKRELEEEARRGISADELRAIVLQGKVGSLAPSPSPGPSPSTPSAPPAPPSSPSPPPSIARTIPITTRRIQRRDWNADELIHRRGKKGGGREGDAGAAAGEKEIAEKPALEIASEKLEMANPGISFKKYFKLGSRSKLLVFVARQERDTCVYLCSDSPKPLVAHWGKSMGKNQEWQPPSSEFCETDFERACETSFSFGFLGDSAVQAAEIIFLNTVVDSTPGLPFVLRSGDAWFKDNGRDFFVSLAEKDLKQAVSSPLLGDAGAIAKPIVDAIVEMEGEAEKSLMHRFNIGSDILEKAVEFGELGLAAVFVWFRFMAARQLVWNNNYNVKPREISSAQNRFTDILERLFASVPEERELVRFTMMMVGRGGEGDVGQRIRDEILVVQHNNDCKGGMMEEWHQKLHNNTSPDDVVICQAILDYLHSGMNIDVYWSTLNNNGVTRERLLSYDRKIVSEPRFNAGQKEGLIRDLNAYMKTLKAVHSGADLESAISKVLGYSQGAKADFMTDIAIHPISGLHSELPGLLQFVMSSVEQRDVVPLLEGLLESRRLLRPSLLQPRDRLKDLLFLDLSLDSMVRTAVEKGMENLHEAKDITYVVCLVLENLCMSWGDNEELVYSFKEWKRVLQVAESGDPSWALQSKAAMDRTRLLLATKAESYTALLQPTAEYMGSRLNVEPWALSIFSEEVIRSGSAASLSLLLNRLDPVLRKAADMGSWQIISPASVAGFVEVVPSMKEVEGDTYARPTVLIAGRVSGEEEIPEGVVALFTADMPDILSHISVRARNGKVCFATCFDEGILTDLRNKRGQGLRVESKGTEISYSVVSESQVMNSQGEEERDSLNSLSDKQLSISRKKFLGKFAVQAHEFTPELVGAKSRNIAGLRGKLPSWIKLPTSVALPFGSFETVLQDPLNQGVASQISFLVEKLEKEPKELKYLSDVRKTVMELKAPVALVEELRVAMNSSGMAFPGDIGNEEWDKAWEAIKKVWASKWNERAFVSMRKVNLTHSDLSMAVLVQEIIQADYAFVIHTTNPSNGREEEIYAEVVKGLGETLVGAYAGRALSFLVNKKDMNSSKVLGFPSKRVGLFICPSVIFRSDSNGEDLEGYAGAGLYDSVPMDSDEERFVDYSVDPIVTDPNFRSEIMKKIAAAGKAIEDQLGSAQDVEGVIKNGELYVVQTRPQM